MWRRVKPLCRASKSAICTESAICKLPVARRVDVPAAVVAIVVDMVGLRCADSS